MFVVHFVCPADGFDVSVVAARKQFEPLVDDDFMHQKISKPVKSNACANAHYPIGLVHTTQHDAEPTGYGKYDKKSIVLFKKTRTLLVVVFMQVPKKSMHDIAMR